VAAGICSWSHPFNQYVIVFSRQLSLFSFLGAFVSDARAEAVTLNQLQEPDSYTVHIREALSSQLIKDIARKHSLSVKEENNMTVAYAPIP